MTRIPYYYPGWDTGLQIANPGEGGTARNLGLLSMQPRSYPTQYRVGTMGLGAMPRQVIGPTDPVIPNQLSNPLTINNLQISGLMKNPRGG
jgi:hypothetical protein